MRTPGDGVFHAVRLLVLRKLVGKPECLEALLSYVRGEISPSEATKYGVTKHQLRGLMQRVREAVGRQRSAEAVVRLATPIVLEKIPVRVDSKRSIPRCLICGRELISIFPEDHIVKHHRNLLEHLTLEVLGEMRNARREPG